MASEGKVSRAEASGPGPSREGAPGVRRKRQAKRLRFQDPGPGAGRSNRGAGLRPLTWLNGGGGGGGVIENA